MEYKMEQKPAMTLVGYKRRFTGTPGGDSRREQEHNFACETRVEEYLLGGMSRDCETTYVVLKNFASDSYDFYFASKVSDWEKRAAEIGREAGRFEVIEVPAQLYVVCETERCMWPCDIHNELRRQMVSQWLPTSGYRLAEAPEMAVIHWPYEKDNDQLNSSRYVEVWLPIEKDR